MRYKLFLSVTVFALISLKPALIRAEWLADLYLGAAITDDSEVKVDRYFSRQSASERTSYDTSFTFGGRIGYWLGCFSLSWFRGGLVLFSSRFRKSGLRNSSLLDLVYAPMALTN